MQNYSYNSEIGTFEIREITHERYELWLEEELLGVYRSPEFAANDVANFDTDYPEWDKYKNELENFPATLDEWDKLEEESPQ